MSLTRLLKVLGMNLSKYEDMEISLESQTLEPVLRCMQVDDPAFANVTVGNYMDQPIVVYTLL